jgi:hypothetical protein
MKDENGSKLESKFLLFPNLEDTRFRDLQKGKMYFQKLEAFCRRHSAMSKNTLHARGCKFAEVV